MAVDLDNSPSMAARLFRRAVLQPAGTVALRSLGFFYLALFAVLAWIDSFKAENKSNDDEGEHAKARKRFWKTSERSDFFHRFITLSSGLKLHYVTNIERRDTHRENLVILIHGFPDSWVLWHDYFTSELATRCALVAVDLPGYGGSASPRDYGPTTALEAMTEFIQGMQELFHPDDDFGEADTNNRTIVLAHDWGTIIGFRLAAEAPQLADRFILTSAFLPALLKSNTSERLKMASKFCFDWIRRPTQFRLLRYAARSLSPVLKQIRCSGYVFVFLLPAAIACRVSTFSDHWFLRKIHQIAGCSRSPLRGSASAHAFARTQGPSPEECNEKSNYPPDVRFRSDPNVNWFEKLRIYREGLFDGTWEKSIETIALLHEMNPSGRRPSTSGRGLHEDGPPGALHAKTTVLYGSRDHTQNPPLAHDGMRDYFCKGCHLIEVQNGGHWLPLEALGREVIEEVLMWSLRGENASLPTALRKQFPGKELEVCVET